MRTTNIKLEIFFNFSVTTHVVELHLNNFNMTILKWSQNPCLNEKQKKNKQKNKKTVINQL